MRRLLAAALMTAAVSALPAPASAYHYTRTCGGIVDAQCRGWVCSLDCFYRGCLLWVDPLQEPQLALCTGPVAPL